MDWQEIRENRLLGSVSIPGSVTNLTLVHSVIINNINNQLTRMKWCQSFQSANESHDMFNVHSRMSDVQDNNPLKSWVFCLCLNISQQSSSYLIYPELRSLSLCVSLIANLNLVRREVSTVIDRKNEVKEEKCSIIVLVRIWQLKLKLVN